LLKNRILILILCICALSSNAQYNEFGVRIGGANYKGDLSPHLFNTDFLHPSVAFFYRHNWDRNWSWKNELGYGRVSGDDAKSSNGFFKDRNLSFYSDILDISSLIEFNFFPYETGNSDYPTTPYIFTGLSFFRFNPKAKLNDQVYNLQPLGTEGQKLNGGKSYKRYSFAIPIGGGFKFSVGRIGIGLEVSARRTYTDYLDDVSTVYPDLQRLLAVSGPEAVLLSDRSFSGMDTSSGIPSVTGKKRGDYNNHDWYVFGGITFYYRMSSLLHDVCKPFKRRRYH